MPDISEAGFDQSCAATLNDAPMGLLDEQVSVLRPSHVWTQAEDEEGRRPPGRS